MKKKFNKALYYVTGSKNAVIYEWEEVVFKLIIIVISAYFIVIIDTFLYDYLAK